MYNIVDLCYKKSARPKVAVEVLLGHGNCHIIIETSEHLEYEEVFHIVNRIAGNVNLDLLVVPQDTHLADNQSSEIRCGDNGIFKGVPTTEEQKKLSSIARELTKQYSYDGKYIIDGDKLIICQSNVKNEVLQSLYPKAKINPLGEWTGGIDVDSGCTNRKLGSDMGDAVTGGGIQGKDYSKADVSVNIFCHILAQELNKEVHCSCAIGDIDLTFYSENKVLFTISFNDVVEEARKYVDNLGGFEKLAEWGLI